VSIERYIELKAKGVVQLELTGPQPNDPVRVIASQFDPYTGEPLAPATRLISRNGLTNEIGKVEAEIAAKQVVLDGLHTLQADIAALNP